MLGLAGPSLNGVGLGLIPDDIFQLTNLSKFGWLFRSLLAPELNIVITYFIACVSDFLDLSLADVQGNLDQLTTLINLGTFINSTKPLPMYTKAATYLT